MRRRAAGRRCGGAGPNKPNGTAWDSVGGAAPDLYTAFSFNGSVVANTSTIDNQYAAPWNQYIDIIFVAGGVLNLTMYDEDTVSDDWVAGWTWTGTSDLVSLARTAGVDFTLNTSVDPDIYLTVSVTPTFCTP